MVYHSYLSLLDLFILHITFPSIHAQILYAKYIKIFTFPSNHGQGITVMKNCDPFVFGPAFAIDKIKGLSCLSFGKTI